MFKIFKKSNNQSSSIWHRSLSNQGISLSHTDIGESLADPLLPGYLAQMRDDGFCVETPEGLFIGWDSFYEVVKESGYTDLSRILNMPLVTKAHPTLQSSNSFTDKNFSIVIGGWKNNSGVQLDCESIGAILNQGDNLELMRPEHWFLSRELIGFARRPDEERSDRSHLLACGRIRKLAQAAGASLDDFLFRSIVLTPEKLEIGLRKSEHVVDDSVIEIEPSFSGAPKNWLSRFDSSPKVLDQYDILTPDGIVQVIVSPKVRTVLEEIKRLPLRRVAGSRAQAFILNPYATLGEDAKDVIVEEQFEQSREKAGLHYERFLPIVERNASGIIVRIGLLIETANTIGPVSSETFWLNEEVLSAFIQKLRVSISKGYQLLGWQGYDFELQGDTEMHLHELERALEELRNSSIMVSYSQVHDLSGYSTRIESIGFEKPYYSPHITKKKDDDGWFPENVVPIIGYVPDGESELVSVPATKENLTQLRLAADIARRAGREAVEVPWLPKSIPLREADTITSTFDEVFRQVNDRRFEPEKSSDRAGEKAGTRKNLILRPNILALEYEEKRRDILRSLSKDPQMPSNLRPDKSLLPHQCEGLAWLQHLYNSQTEYHVRGAVLADDMGLGKTFQLLSFIAWLVEKDRNIAPMLVVAPVSLLENWAEEADKFFLSGTLSILTAYGESLHGLRVPKEAIDSRLRTEDGLVRFLRPNWIGNAKVVLTTYETLRDLEFSFAAQKWSIMVCDEAQRIKNPAAMVTRSAKKQNVGFKIACTGTPVENTLADLWCLFDFVQPGLLGALNDFGKQYRRPIEAKTDEERGRVEELRNRIAPQILRRTKAEVAKDLPKKIIVEDCGNLPLSTEQRNLYVKAIEDFKHRNNPNSASPFKNHLGLLQYLRLICTDPRRHGLTVFKPERLSEYRVKAPKLDWLIDQLEKIRSLDDKVIIFCEFREIQRLLQYYIEEVFHIRSDIINGDTSALSSNTASRQKRLKAFQASSGFGVIILSPVAVGFGVNIQGANHVIHYTRTWNPAKEDQATDRAYRIGQKKNVYVYYPVVHADDFRTFDVKLDQLLTYKRELADDMLNGAGEISPSDFNIVDVVPKGDAEAMEERINLEMALRMNWRHFEGLIGVLWKKRGFDVSYCTPGTNDNGVDVVAISGSLGELVQTKTSSIDGSKLGWDTVKELTGGEAFYCRRHPNVKFKKVGLTNQYFNSQAHEQAELNNVELLDQRNLAELLSTHEVMMIEIERLLYTDWSQGFERN